VWCLELYHFQSHNAVEMYIKRLSDLAELLLLSSLTCNFTNSDEALLLSTFFDGLLHYLFTQLTMAELVAIIDSLSCQRPFTCATVGRFRCVDSNPGESSVYGCRWVAFGNTHTHEHERVRVENMTDSCEDSEM